MYRELIPELAKIAKEQLNENPSQIANVLQSLREWISKQPHLRARKDDQWLLVILRGCKFSLERVKVKLDTFYTVRSTAPEITLRIKPTEPGFLTVLRFGSCIILPQSEKHLHPSIIILRPGVYDPERYNVADIMCILYYLVQILVIENDFASVMGTKILVDYRGCTVNHMTQANPVMLRKMVSVTQDSLPLRLKGSHHLNVPSGIEIIFKLVSGFISEKAKERLKIHKSNEELFEYLPKDVLPVEYGGSGKTITEIIDYWARKVVEYKPWWQEEMQYGTDESKRIGKPSGAVFSDQGSFRALDID